MTIKKYYLLAVLGMAANMLVVNDVRAMKVKETNNESLFDQYNKQSLASFNNKYSNILDNDCKNEFTSSYMFPPKDSPKSQKCKYLAELSGFLLQWENTINFMGGVVTHLANNYFNLWKNKVSWHHEFGCFGWNTRRFANDHLQFGFNINLPRCSFWIIIYITETINRILLKEKRFIFRNKNLYTSNIISPNNKILKAFIFLLQGFLSLPLVIYFPNNFSIAISIDSLIWMLIGKTYGIYKNMKSKTKINKELKVIVKNKD